MKTFNEEQMSDPWAWCQRIIDEHQIPSPRMAEACACPQSTMRALYAGKNENPRYDLLRRIIGVCIRVANGDEVFEVEKPVEGKIHAAVYNFLDDESVTDDTSDDSAIEAFL